MLVASKYEEIWAPEVKDFVFISDEAYTREQILEMEKIMLNTLRFNLTVPTAFAFLHRYLKAGIIPRHPQVRTSALPLAAALLLCDSVIAAWPSPGRGCLRACLIAYNSTTGCWLAASLKGAPPVQAQPAYSSLWLSGMLHLSSSFKNNAARVRRSL